MRYEFSSLSQSKPSIDNATSSVKRLIRRLFLGLSLGGLFFSPMVICTGLITVLSTTKSAIGLLGLYCMTAFIGGLIALCIYSVVTAIRLRSVIEVDRLIFAIGLFATLLLAAYLGGVTESGKRRIDDVDNSIKGFPTATETKSKGDARP